MRFLQLDIVEPSLVANTDIPLWDVFFRPLYESLYTKIDASSAIYPHINFDNFKNELRDVLNLIPIDQQNILRRYGPNGTITASEWRLGREHKALMIFLFRFPIFANLISNVHLLTQITIDSTEEYLGIKINASNFIQAKQFIDRMNRERWNREQDTSERQSGVSNLGSVSERLLEIAMGNLIDGMNFFKSNNQEVKSYGDFVLMCLPNNLWLSVKSNFARERLLASGYTTDIVGVGFFTELEEFTSLSKIRNYQRVGFLGMYLPDVPVSQDQIENDTNTFDQVINYYTQQNIPLPKNINGTTFLRRLSSIYNDISKLLEKTDISNRTTLSF